LAEILVTATQKGVTDSSREYAAIIDSSRHHRVLPNLDKRKTKISETAIMMTIKVTAILFSSLILTPSLWGTDLGFTNNKFSGIYNQEIQQRYLKTIEQ
jgi:hypothetical protein